MTMQLRIPLLASLSIVDRANQVFELDAKPQLGRAPHGATNLLGKVLLGRLRIGDVPLPTFVDRDSPGREELIAALERRLSAVDFEAAEFRADLTHLSAHIAGREQREVGMLAQQVIGRCFDPGFQASKESYEDARLISNWVSSPSLRSAWIQLSGQLGRARERAWQRCRHDRMMLHGTVQALPNVVEAFERMRALLARRPHAQVDEMMRECLVGPPRLLRVARADVEAQGLRVHAGGQVVYDLQSVRKWDPTYDVFMRGRWNQCPAHGLIPRLLSAVWRRAQHDLRRPTLLQLVQSSSGIEPTPLSEAARSELTQGNLETLKQWELDQLYARLSAGPLPEGTYEGRFFFPEGIGLRCFSEAAPALSRIVGLRLAHVAALGGLLWKGKAFFPTGGDQGLVRNIIEHSAEVAPLLGVLPSALRHTQIEGREVALMFPARLFRGQSLHDPNRESIIIDYDEGPSIDGYLPSVDFLAGRKGLRIRDEIRLVRPGLYLGRAYTDQRLLLMFTLYNPTVEARGQAWLRDPIRAGNGGGQARPDAIQA